RGGAARGCGAARPVFPPPAARTALITAYDPIYCNLRSVGGPRNGAVMDARLQEIDVRTGLVRFEWTSLDHVPISESYAPARGSTPSWPFDFFHINSIDPAPDGSLLVSARNTWTVYDVDGSSGRIAWRLGGKHTSFRMGPGASSAWQHDPRELADGKLSILDNGASPKVHQQSRGIVIRLDAERHSATLVRQLSGPTPVVAESQGSMQALANGDWVLSWVQVGGFPELT